MIGQTACTRAPSQARTRYVLSCSAGRLVAGAGALIDNCLDSRAVGARTDEHREAGAVRATVRHKGRLAETSDVGTKRDIA